MSLLSIQHADLLCKSYFLLLVYFVCHVVDHLLYFFRHNLALSSYYGILKFKLIWSETSKRIPTFRPAPTGIDHGP